MNLEPIDPETALELSLAEKETEAAKATIDSHRSRLGFFLRWCDERGIENLNELTGRRLHEFRLWRRNVGELRRPARRPRWIPFGSSFGGSSPSTPSSRTSTSRSGRRTSRRTNTREVMLEYYSRYEYASLPHVTVSLLWHTMMRLGAARALDVEDYDRDEQCLELRHRPETGTPVKNKKRGERLVALSGELCLLLDDWLRDRRPDVTDVHDRRPLLATAQGRVAGTTIRKYCYQCTRPCVYGDGCPHGRNPDDCDANEPDNASQCPSSVSPHAFRRGSITHYLNNDVPETAVSDRASVSQEVLEQHYDQRSKRDKMQQRRKYLDNI